jgi:hypothetical protein
MQSREYKSLFEFPCDFTVFLERKVEEKMGGKLKFVSIKSLFFFWENKRSDRGATYHIDALLRKSQPEKNELKFLFR